MFLLCRYTDTHYKMTISLSVRADKIICGADAINSLSICQTLGPLRVHMEHQIPPRPLAHHQHCHQRFIRRRHHRHGLCSLRQCGLRATVVTPSSGDPPFLPLSLPQRSLGILSFAPGRKRPPPFFAIIFLGKDGALPPLSELSIV